MNTWKLFGREPVYWLGLISATIMLMSAFFIPLSIEVQGAINAACAAGFGLLTAYFVARDGLQAAILGFIKALIALALAFGWHATPEAQSTIMMFVAAASAMFTRTQVTAPVSVSGTNVPKDSLTDKHHSETIDRMRRLVIAFLLPAISFGTLATSTLTLTSCTTAPKIAEVAPGNDPVVVNAERAYQLAFDTIDAVFTSDEDNRAVILKYAPAVHTAINDFKPRAKQALANVKNTLHAYKYHRTEDNKANLSTYLITLEAALKEAQGYQTKLNSVTP